jgi:thiamine-monophosphate kinase
VIGRKSDRRWQLLKTDCVVEGVHFLASTDPRKAGRKALARALSDIAAMGGLPDCALVTIAAPPDRDVAWIKRFFAGLRAVAEEFGVSIVGGETARSPGSFFCSVALTGFVERTRCVTRAGGNAGDAIYVTGRLGGSIRGKHLAFTPRIREARWLTQHFKIRAMMDLSDGLGSDLPRLALASGAGFIVHEEKIPANKGCTTKNALADGEDYELLFTVSPKESARLEAAWKKEFPRLALTRIGELTKRSKRAPQKKSPHGFDHFA